MTMFIVMQYISIPFFAVSIILSPLFNQIFSQVQGGIIVVAVLVVNLYIALCMHSLYEKIKEEKNQSWRPLELDSNSDNEDEGGA
jgi:hypothetical protein